jgi:hypothetical protein
MSPRIERCAGFVVCEVAVAVELGCTGTLDTCAEHS